MIVSIPRSWAVPNNSIVCCGSSDVRN
jgi:hypothetical protein